MIIGLCGASGAGKSTVAALFRKEGCRVIDCDALVHTLDSDGEYQRKLGEAFGAGYAENGTVNRKKLGALVFSDGEKLALLNSIIAPFVRRLVMEELGKAKKDRRVTVLDAPLLFEYGLEAHCDLVVGVIAAPEVAVSRLMARDGKNEEELAARRAHQHGNEYYEQKCDLILRNDGSLSALSAAFSELKDKIREKASEAVPRKKKKRRVLPFVLLFGLLLICIAALYTALRYDDICRFLELRRYPREYRIYVEESAERYGVEPNMIYAMMKAESDFCETAVSGVGAIGLMQVMPSTFEEDICHRIGLPASPTLLFSPRENIEAGTYYFAKWFHYFGSYTEALASYNAGVGNVEKWLADERYATLRGLIPERIPFAETRAYLLRVLSYKEKYDALYGVTLLPKKETVPEGVCYRLALQYGAEYSIDPRFILAIAKAESSFIPTAVSPSGAVGIMQIMRPTYEGDIKRRLSLDEEFEALFDVEFGMMCGSYYIHWLSGVFAGYPEIAAAYNGGIGNVREWLADPAFSEDGKTLRREKIPSAQTRRYVEKVMTFYDEYCARYPQGE